MVSLNDLADRPPRPLADGEVLDLGGKRVRHLDTPHVPHGWDARVLFEETTGTLFCGDLFTHLGNGPALTEEDIVDPASVAETCSTPPVSLPPPGRPACSWPNSRPNTLAVMHGSSFTGDCADALRRLADDYDARIAASLPA